MCIILPTLSDLTSFSSTFTINSDEEPESMWGTDKSDEISPINVKKQNKILASFSEVGKLNTSLESIVRLEKSIIMLGIIKQSNLAF